MCARAKEANKETPSHAPLVCVCVFFSLCRHRLSSRVWQTCALVLLAANAIKLGK